MSDGNGATDPAEELRHTLSAIDRALVQVELADIVRLKAAYKGYTHGIVAEVLSALPDGRTRTVSLYLYDPESKEIFLGPNGIPQFVDFHTSQLMLFKRATEPGYEPLP